MGPAGDPGREAAGDPGRGAAGDGSPRLSATGIVCSIGGLWGLLGYSVLWEGAPFAVQRPFVQSLGGTLVLLPVRTVLWGIHAAERVQGRTFDFSDNHWWIGVLAGALGAGAVLAAWGSVRALARRAAGAGASDPGPSARRRDRSGR